MSALPNYSSTAVFDRPRFRTSGSSARLRLVEAPHRSVAHVAPELSVAHEAIRRAVNVVVACIGLVLGFRTSSRLALRTDSSARFEKALDQFRLDMGRYPSTEEGLAALMNKPAGDAGKWAGPYLKKAVPNDPWGKPYQYVQPGEHGEFDLYSLGKDGQPGGTGEAADVVNW